ncbi:MAG: FG-GAP-like repeat-containing protein, partial [Synergistaceae bacterium]|nr:FG-GAP-like repeat-containing protein [Synergistaceae bacterium]
MRSFSSYKIILFITFISSMSIANGQQTLSPPAQTYVLRFSGNQIAIAPNVEKLDLGASFTMEAWIYMEDSAGGLILGRTISSGGYPNRHYSIETVGNGRQILFAQSTGKSGMQNTVQSTESVELNTWSHIAATVGSGQMKLYINGKEVDSQSSPGIPQIDTTHFAIGGGNWPGCQVQSGFSGAMREVRVWNRTLSGDEIKANAVKVITGSEQGLVAYWKLNEGIGQIANDYSNNQYHLQLGTTSKTDSNDPDWIKINNLENGGTFEVKQYSGLTSKLHGFTLIDFDTDGDKDLIGDVLDNTLSLQNLVALENDGQGNFIEASQKVFINGSPQTTKITGYLSGDFDKNGLNDLFMADLWEESQKSASAQSHLLVQNNSRLIDRTMENLSLFYRDFTPHYSGQEICVSSADVDQDGDEDILFQDPFAPRIYINNSLGVFTRDSLRLPIEIAQLRTSRSPGFSASCFIDIEQDKDFDIILGSEQGTDVKDYVLLINDGVGNFNYSYEQVIPTKIGAPYWHTISITASDFNGDGWEDFVALSRNDNWSQRGIQLIISNMDGTFYDATLQMPSQDLSYNSGINAISPVDMNGDGCIDLILSDANYGLKLYLNIGNAVFVKADEFLPKVKPYGKPFVADINGDKLVDIVYISNDSTINALINKRNISIDELLRPTVTSVSNLSLQTGDAIEISGKHLIEATSVLLNKDTANIYQCSDSLILAICPGPIELEKLTVTTPIGAVVEDALSLRGEDIIKPLNAGWTWFSLPVQVAEMSIQNVLLGLQKSNGDYIKNQTVSATFYEGYGWFGDLQTFQAGETYKIKLKESDTLRYSGNWIDPADHSAYLNQGWNWRGVIAQS